MSPTDVDVLCGALTRSASALKTGNGTSHSLVDFEQAGVVAAAIEKTGVVKGLASEIAQLQLVITNIRSRMQDSADGPVILYGPEIATLDDFCRFHRFQLSHLSVGEYAKILQRAGPSLGPQLHSTIAQTLAGK